MLSRHLVKYSSARVLRAYARSNHATCAATPPHLRRSSRGRRTREPHTSRTRTPVSLRPWDGRQRLELSIDTDGIDSNFAGEPDCEKTSWSLEKHARREELERRR